jgi:hypothetical protein
LRVASMSARCAIDFEPGTRMRPAIRPGRIPTSIAAVYAGPPIDQGGIVAVR